eukprot:scaffold9446_cov72-Skeletonema_dohrnii-CCMP3373.AAC.10
MRMVHLQLLAAGCPPGSRNSSPALASNQRAKIHFDEFEVDSSTPTKVIPTYLHTYSLRGGTLVELLSWNVRHRVPVTETISVRCDRPKAGGGPRPITTKILTAYLSS